MSVQFASLNYTAFETDCLVTVEIRLNSSAEIPLTFDLTTSSDIAVAGQDFVHVSKMPLTVNPGSTASEASIQILNDNEVEKEVESFTVQLEQSGGVARGDRVSIAENMTTVYIQDDDISPTDLGRKC